MGTHKRKCWDCGKVDEYESDVIPGVLCKKCGSRDTRRIRTPRETKYVPAEVLLALNGIDLDNYSKATAAIEAVFDRFGINHVILEK